MLERSMTSVPIDGGQMPAYLSHPKGKSTGAILLLQEIFGVTPAMKAIADDLASAGFVVLVPDIYWRMEPNLDLGNGEDETLRNLAVDYSMRYDYDKGVMDLVSCFDWLQAQHPMAGAPAVMGFCLGGRLAVDVAGSAEASAMVSMYGIGLSDKADAIAKVGCPAQFHFGENDNHNPMEKIKIVESHVASRNNDEDAFYTYPEAEHAFFNPSRLDRFDQAAHDLARERVLAFLRRNG